VNVKKVLWRILKALTMGNLIVSSFVALAALICKITGTPIDLVSEVLPILYTTLFLLIVALILATLWDPDGR